MIVSHKHRFIFLKTKKTGGSSVEIALRALCDDDVITPGDEDRGRTPWRKPQNYLYPKRDWPLGDLLNWSFRHQWRLIERRHSRFHTHMTAAEAREKLGEKVWSSYFKFSIERNPWDRQVSGYYFRQGLPHIEQMSFLETVKSSAFNNWDIYSIGETVVADHVIRYSNDLQKGLEEALRKIGVSAPPLTNAKGAFRPKGIDYRELYDDETREIIRRRYQREIDYFGWTF